MPSIPIDVLQEILERVDKKDLATICRVNKTCCSCSQDVLYREIYGGDKRVIQTLALSTDLARRVRSFGTHCECPELATALRNMSSLRNLNLLDSSDESILDGCTFKLDSFACSIPYSESLQKFLNSQPGLTSLTILDYEPWPQFDERCSPNLTLVMANPSLLRMLIPGRPVREVAILPRSRDNSIDLSYFTLTTTPIQNLTINYNMLYPKPVSLLVSIRPSLVHLVVYANWTICVRLCLSI